MSDKMGWFFLSLAVIFLFIASNSRWRKNWGWGRTGQAGELSFFGWGAWISAFLVISGFGFGILPAEAVVIAFCFVMFAGIFDSHRQRSVSKSRRRRGKW